MLGETNKAAGLLDKARTSIGRRFMGVGRIGGRWNFLNGMVFFQRKKVADGDAAIMAAMRYMEHGSHWLLQILLADKMALASSWPRQAMEIYESVLRDPGPADWSSDPMESLAVLITPHPLPYENWFKLALQRKDLEAAIEIGDRMRRHRFFSSMAYGGRLTSLRWILEASDDALDTASKLQRQDLLTRFPAYEQLRQKAHNLHDQLASMPLATEDHEPSKGQTQALAQLLSVSQQQETILREMAVRREPAEMVFPPLRKTADILKSLPTGHALLIFVATTDWTYGFLLTPEQYGQWQVSTPVTLLQKHLAGHVAARLRQLLADTN